MTTPNTGELLVQQAQEAERLRLLILADECKTNDEFREKLRERLNKRRGPVLARHPPTLDNPARAASSPPPSHGYSIAHPHGKSNAAGAAEKIFPHRGNTQPPKKSA